MSAVKEGEVGRPTFSPPQRRQGSWRRAVWQGCVAGWLLAVAGNWSYVLLGSNFHTVLPGQVYRCAQPSGDELDSLIQRYGIRTVINLRGCCPATPWYREESQVTHRRGVAQEDVSLSAVRPPSIHELRRLVEVLDRCEFPALMHCIQGADRTGMAAAIALLLQPDSSLAAARHQLSFRYGHLRVGRTASLDRVLDLYDEWLGQQGADHSPALFRRWAREDYCPDGCRAALELLDLLPEVPADRPFGVQLRAHNTSIRTWRLRAGTGVGVHAVYWLFDEAGRDLLFREAGLFDAEVPPGQSIDLTLPLPSLEPGTYRLRVDLADGQRCHFVQMGSEPLEQEFVIRGQETAFGSRRVLTGLAGLADRLGPSR